MTYKHFKVIHRKTGKTLTEGHYPSLAACLEDAVENNTDLSGAKLDRQNLSHANLDGARLEYATFAGSNMMGINLSDAHLKQSDFTNTSLQGACFCASDLRGSDFTGALFGNTDIADADISRSCFSSLSAARMNFMQSRSMRDCMFLSEAENVVISFSRPPVCITGLSAAITIFDQHIKIGARTFPVKMKDGLQEQNIWSALPKILAGSL